MKKIVRILSRLKFLICIIVGLSIGLIFKEKAAVIRPVGTIFINMIFVIIVPLVFISITLSIAKIKSKNKLKSIFLYSFLVFVATLFITGVLTVAASLLINPYSELNIVANSVSEVEKISLADRIVGMLSVNDFSLLLSKTNVLPLIIFSILIGISVYSLDNNDKILGYLSDFQRIIKKYLNIIMKFAPIGITCYLGALIGEYGSTFMSSYLVIFIMYISLGFINIIVFHTVYLLVAGGFKLVKTYYKNIIKLIVTAASTQSSVVTMPTNIEVLEEMDLDKEVIDICTPVATLINMQGNVIENILKIFLISALFSMPLGNITHYIFYILVAAFAGMITAGIPGGGVVSNSILVSMLGMPIESLPILITIEWLLDAPATAFNILSDTSTLPLVNKMIERNIKSDNKRKKN